MVLINLITKIVYLEFNDEMLLVRRYYYIFFCVEKK